MRKIAPLALACALVFGHTVQAATPADTLIVAISLDGIISFDPAESFETVSNSSLINVYQTLVTPDIDDPRKLAPSLTTEWQAGSSEHSLLFTLKPGAKFASGNPVTSQDVIYSLTRAVKLNKTPAFILAEFGWTPENIDTQFTPHGDNQIEIRWTTPIGQDLALRLLTSPIASVVDSKLVQQHAQGDDLGNGWLHTHSAGSVAYTISNYVPQQALVLEQNPYAQTPPHLKRVILKSVTDAGSRRLLLDNCDAYV